MSKKDLKNLVKGVPIGSVFLSLGNPVCGIHPAGGNRLTWGAGGKKPFSKTGEWPIEIYELDGSDAVVVSRKGKPTEILYPSMVLKIILLDDNIAEKKAILGTSGEQVKDRADNFEKEKLKLAKSKEKLKAKFKLND